MQIKLPRRIPLAESMGPRTEPPDWSMVLAMGAKFKEIAETGALFDADVTLEVFYANFARTAEKDLGKQVGMQIPTHSGKAEGLLFTKGLPLNHTKPQQWESPRPALR